MYITVKSTNTFYVTIKGFPLISWRSELKMCDFFIFKQFEIFLDENLYKKKWSILNTIYTMSWELWKHPDPVPGGRPIFFKPKWPKESKNGFQTINYRRYPVVIFSKKLFLVQKNHQKNWTFCWILNFYGNIYGQIRPVLKNLTSGHSESVKILPKC